MQSHKSNQGNGLHSPKVLQEPPLSRSGSGGAAALGATGFQAELDFLVADCHWEEVVPSLMSLAVSAFPLPPHCSLLLSLKVT